MSMANRIRELRHARSLSLEEVARMAGTTIQQISRLERGQRRLTDDWMHRIAAALSVPPAELLPKRAKVEQEIVESLEELKVLRWWRAMSREQKFLVITFAKGMGNEISVRVQPPIPRRA